MVILVPLGTMDDKKKIPRSNTNHHNRSYKETSNILNRKPTEYLPESQMEIPEASQSCSEKTDDSYIHVSQKIRYMPWPRTPHEGQRGWRRTTFFDQSRLKDAPAVGCSDEPPGDYRASGNNHPALTSFRDLGVCNKGCLYYIVWSWSWGELSEGFNFLPSPGFSCNSIAVEVGYEVDAMLM